MAGPPSTYKGWSLVLLVVIVVGLLAALWVSGSTLEAQEPTVDANVSERYRSVETLSATRTVTQKHNGTVTSRTVGNITRALGTNQKRIRFQDASSRRYELQVSNESTLWLHDTDNESVTVIELTGPPRESTFPMRLEALVAAAGLTDNAGRPTQPDIAPLPAVPRQSGAEPRLAAQGGYSVKYVTTSEVDGHEVYVLNVSLEAAEEDMKYHQKLWLDTTRFYPLQTQTVWVDSDGRHSTTTTYTNVTFEAPVTNETFQPEITDSTTVNTPKTPNTEVYESISALRTDSSTSVPRPSVPSAFEFAYATQTTGRIHGVGLRYVDEERELTVAKFNYSVTIDEDEKHVTVAGRPATLELGPTTSVSWNCNDYAYTVRGTGVSRDQLVEVARSVGCPA
ncbi:outer membrane lipoprotein carrier protein LolA (plasmid) [Haloferax sp. S1W]|uniref:outer membrane lipoprotein carrier protein LolA n=1 Tax=Haloferax sp. S1W TaxID=3377110 RepID=UPI0037C9CAFE